MAKARDILASGALGLGPAVLAKNPELLQGLGLAGNLLYKSLDNKDEKDKAAKVGMPAQPGMKKGGKVKSASKRADGCAQRGKTRGKIV